jgi:hypothetical protein
MKGLKGHPPAIDPLVSTHLQVLISFAPTTYDLCPPQFNISAKNPSHREKFSHLGLGESIG